MKYILYNPERAARPRCGLPVLRIERNDGWCDAPGDPNYNRPVRLPYAGSAERMWRADPLYDIVVVLAHNDVPRIRGGGSAIFLHIARDGYLPTEGCIAIAARNMRRLLAGVGRGSRIVIGG